jgi:hypothetical protein
MEINYNGLPTLSASPAKTKSKKYALESLITPQIPKLFALTVAEPKSHLAPGDAETSPSLDAHSRKQDRNKMTSSSKEKKKINPTYSQKPPSAIKDGKYMTSTSPKVAPKPHDHVYKKVGIDTSIDFSKETLAHLPTNGKKLTHAVTQLLQNMVYVDVNAQINCSDPLHGTWLGEGGIKVPENMKKLQNFILNMNLKQFKSISGNGYALDSLRPGGPHNKVRSKNMYFSFYLSCDVEPTKLVEQISFEWCKFGNFLKGVELQSVNTSTPILIYKVYSMVPRATSHEEVSTCLKAIHDDLVLATDFFSEAVSWETTITAPPQINVHLKVAHIPRAKSSHALSKLPGRLQSCRQAFHIKVAASDVEHLRELVRYGKKKGFFKEYLGPHSHPTVVAMWESSENDIKRSEKILKEFISYNASMTSTDIHGIHNLSCKVPFIQHGLNTHIVSG